MGPWVLSARPWVTAKVTVESRGLLEQSKAAATGRRGLRLPRLAALLARASCWSCLALACEVTALCGVTKSLQGHINCQVTS